MIKRPILTIMFAAITFVVTLTAGIMNDNNMKASVLGDFIGFFESTADPMNGSIFTPLLRLDPEEMNFERMDLVLDDNVVVGKYGEWSYCQYEAPKEPLYDIEFLSVNLDENIEGGEVFLADFELKNTGNVRLFSQDSGCEDFTHTSVGTQNEIDRESYFGTEDVAISGWTGANRFKIVEDYVDPGETFHAKFQSIAPKGDDIHREWFQPVVEGVSWIGEPFYADIDVDNPTESMFDNISYAYDASVSASELEGLERNLEVDLSDQKMFAKMGDLRLWELRVSTGAAKTPTPTGDYQILNKQELRVGYDWPHYRMPYWQGWRSDGYGLHALPYLGEEGGGDFWSEALDHIGTPVSHGCIRQLPEDAERLYEFTSISTPLSILY